MNQQPFDLESTNLKWISRAIFCAAIPDVTSLSVYGLAANWIRILALSAKIMHLARMVEATRLRFDDKSQVLHLWLAALRALALFAL